MKIEIYEEKGKEEEKIVRLTMWKNLMGNVIIGTMDDDGETEALVYFSEKGITRFRDSQRAGFPTDDDGRVKLDE